MLHWGADSWPRRMLQFVMPGLDTASRVYRTCGASYAELGQARVLWHPSKRSASSIWMDCRVKPGNDGSESAPTSRRGELLVLGFRALQRRARRKPIGVSNELG